MKNPSKKVSSIGKGSLAEAKDRLVGSFDPEKFLRDNPMLAVELLLLMVGEDLTPTKFFGKVSVDFPEMEVAHAEELVLLFLFLRGKSARSTSSGEEHGDEAHVKKADSAPASRRAGVLPKAKIGSIEDFVKWLGGEKSARKNLPIRIKEAESIVKLAGGLGVNSKTMTHWIKKIRDGVFTSFPRKDGGSKKAGGADSGKKLKDDDDVREFDSAPADRPAGILPKGKIGSFDDFVEWLGGEEKALDTLSARVKKIGSAANLIKQIKANEATFYSWVRKLKSRKTKSNLKPNDNSGGSRDFEPSSASERVLSILKDRETARGFILRYRSLKSLAGYLNDPGEGGNPVKYPVTPNNLSFILNAKFGLSLSDVLNEDGSSGSVSSKPSAIALEVEKLSGVDQNTKDALIALAKEREVDSLRDLFDSVDDGENNLSRAAMIFFKRGIIKRSFPPDYTQFKRALIKR